MKKTFVFRLLCAFLLVSMTLTACSLFNNTQKPLTVEKSDPSEEPVVEPIDVSVGFVDGIPALGIAKLAKEMPSITDYATINYELIKGSDLIVSKVMNQELDIAVVPSNLASTVYNQGEAYLIGALTGFGNLYIISREPIESLDGLKGREITTIGKGLTPDIVFQYVLKANNIDPEEDVTINYMGGATELAPAFLSNKADIILAPEPMISTIISKDPTAIIQFSLNQLYAKAAGAQLGFPQTALVIKKDLINNHPDFVNTFLNEYEESVDWAIGNLKDLENYGLDLDITIPAGVLNEDSIQRMNLSFVTGNEMKDVYMRYIDILSEFQPKTIGGKVPNEGIFFEK